MTVQKLIDLLNLIPDKNLLVEVESWDESVPATDIYITTHDEPQHHVDDNGNPIEFTDYVLIDGQWGTKTCGKIHIAIDYAEKHPNVNRLLEQKPTTRNCFGCKHSKDNHNAGTEECHLCMWQNQYTPTTKNDLGVDECISKQAVLNKILKFSVTDGRSVSVTSLWTEVNGLPSVTPQPCEDAISRQAVLDMAGLSEWFDSSDSYNDFAIAIEKLPSVTPQEQQTFEWCDTCKEYDQEKHCCHRWSKVIRNTVEEMKQEQKLILDKIRTEIIEMTSNRGFLSCETSAIHEDINAVFDKYKVEQEK